MTRALLLALLLASCAPAEASTALDTVCFAPPTGCAAQALALVAKAKHIRAQEYELTAPTFLSAFADARDRGADVELVLDARQTAACRTLAPLGVTVLLDGAHAIAHEKAIVLDRKTVIGGSYNLSIAAEHRNAEDMTIRTNRALATAFLNNYETHRGHSVLCAVPDGGGQ